MKLEDLKERLTATGLSDYFDILIPWVRTTIRLYHTETPEDQIPLGQTKIGGRPDLPLGVTWVTETNQVVTKEKKFLLFHKKREETVSKPLSFIAQINLAQVAPHDTEGLLPASGILYFFYSAEQEAWGFDPKDQNKFRVLYHACNPPELVRTDFPADLPEEARFTACAVRAQQEISLPSADHEVYGNFSVDDSDLFWEEVNKEDNLNKLLGYADTIQGDMEVECDLVTNGLFCGDPSGYNHPKAKKLRLNAANWRLLLQIDTNDENGMMWGDSGRLYFWIKKDDLLTKHFDKAWFSLQCY